LGDDDNGVFNIRGSSLRASGIFDFETKSSYSIRVRSVDRDGIAIEKTFAISVTDTNDPPIAIEDFYWVSLDTPQFLSLLENDTDSDRSVDLGEIEIVGSPQHGIANRTSDGRVLYTPAEGYRGHDSFTYRLRDSLGGVSNQASVRIRVNSAPTPVADSLLAKQGVTTTLHVLANDSDPDGTLDPSTLSIVSFPSMADLVVQTDGRILFTPRSGFLGPTQFRYVVSDTDGRKSAPTDVTVLVVVSVYQNPRSRYDVDDDGSVSPLDVLVLVNLLNSTGVSLPVDGLPGPPPYVDVNGDASVDPLDVLDVINFINSRTVQGSGEGEAYPENMTHDPSFARLIEQAPSRTDYDADRLASLDIVFADYFDEGSAIRSVRPTHRWKRGR
jgi:hypothetical protein